MNTPQSVKADERTVAVLYASNAWALNFVLFALLIDIWYRARFRHEVAWDLIALFGIIGAIITVYLARHKVLGQVFGGKVAIIFAVVALVVGAVLAMIKAM